MRRDQKILALLKNTKQDFNQKIETFFAENKILDKNIEINPELARWTDFVFTPDGNDIKENKIILSPDAIEHFVNEHFIDKDSNKEFRQYKENVKEIICMIPDIIFNPDLILRGNKKNSIILLKYDKTDENGQPMMVVIDSNREEVNKNYKVNYIETYYSKRNIDTFLEIEINIEHRLLAYNTDTVILRQKKGDNFISHPLGLQLPIASSGLLLASDSILTFDSNYVKKYGKNDIVSKYLKYIEKENKDGKTGDKRKYCYYYTEQEKKETIKKYGISKFDKRKVQDAILVKREETRESLIEGKSKTTNVEAIQNFINFLEKPDILIVEEKCPDKQKPTLKKLLETALIQQKNYNPKQIKSQSKDKDDLER